MLRLAEEEGRRAVFRVRRFNCGARDKFYLVVHNDLRAYDRPERERVQCARAVSDARGFESSLRL